MDLGWAIDFSRGRDSSGSEPAPGKSVRSGSAAVSVGLRCLLLVVIVSRLGSDARFFFVLRKRFLNLGGRGRAADQNLASETLVPLRLKSGIPDRLTSDECVFPCVGSQPVFPSLQGGMDDSTGFPEDALDEASTKEVTFASAKCAGKGKDKKGGIGKGKVKQICRDFNMPGKGCLRSSSCHFLHEQPAMAAALVASAPAS